MSASTKISIRVDPSVVERLDALISDVAATLGSVATRSDVLREAMMLGLRTLEARGAKAIASRK